MIFYCLKFALIRARKRGGKMSEKEMTEIKEMFLLQMQMITEQIKMTKTLLALVPDKASIAFLAETTGKTRQAIAKYIKNIGYENTDYWYENGKLTVSQEMIQKVIARRAK